jgi:CHASE3 domain sensor protein
MKYINQILEYRRTPFILAGIIFLASLALLSVFKGAERQLEELNRAVAIADEMSTSSDNLTNYARYYVTTRSDTWKVRFDQVLKVRSGEEPDAHGKKLSFKDKVKTVGYTETELGLILKAEELSNNLALLEVKAFESIEKGRAEGIWDVQQFHYMSAQLAMFGDDYNQYKGKIMTTIQQFTDQVFERLQRQYQASMNIAWVLIIVINLALLMLVLTIQHSRQSVPVKKSVPAKRPVTRKKPIKKQGV